MLPFLTSLLLASAAIGNTAAPNDIVFAARSTEYAWVVPAGVFEISGLAVGAGGNGYNEFLFSPGGGGEGGALVWANKIKVTPGETLHIKAGLASSAHGGDGSGSYIRRGSTYLIRAQGGGGSGQGEFHEQNTPIGVNATTGQETGGGRGGANGHAQSATYAGAGGGAGGYSGVTDMNTPFDSSKNGGNGALASSSGTRAGFAGRGGGGGGGSATTEAGYSGGGVGLYGQGANGAGGAAGAGGGGGSGGAAGIATPSNAVNQAPGIGAGGASFDMSSNTAGWQRGGNGAVRILWGRGPNNGGRAFPATNVFTSTS